MQVAKPGDVVRLAKSEGILIDHETGFEIAKAQEKELGETIGERTRQALLSGGLLVISDKPKTKGKTKEVKETE